MGVPRYHAWDDLRVPVNSLRRLGTTDPDWVKLADDGAGSVGVYVLAFDGGGTRDEEVTFSVQMPHGWAIGTEIKPHVHWGPSDANAGNVRWVLEYTIANIGEAFGTTTLAAVNDPSDQVAKGHQIGSLGDISMTGKTLSCMLNCRLMREATDAGDTYGSDAYLYEVDFHILLDTPGSREVLTK